MAIEDCCKFCNYWGIPHYFTYYLTPMTALEPSSYGNGKFIDPISLCALYLNDLTSYNHVPMLKRSLPNTNYFPNYHYRVRNKRRVTLSNFGAFFEGPCLLILGFLHYFNLFFLWLCNKSSNYLLFKKEGLRLFKELYLLFFQNYSRGYVYSRGYIYSVL